MPPDLDFQHPQGPRKRNPVNVAKASHSHRRWVEVSSSAPHLLHTGLSINPIMLRCLLRVLRPVRRPVTTLDSILVIASRLGPWDQFLSLSFSAGYSMPNYLAGCQASTCSFSVSSAVKSPWLVPVQWTGEHFPPVQAHITWVTRDLVQRTCVNFALLNSSCNWFNPVSAWVRYGTQWAEMCHETQKPIAPVA
jgi:hypothetical protein